MVKPCKLQNKEFFSNIFILDHDSPSGIVWKHTTYSGKYRSVLSTEAGSVAGFLNSRNYWVVGINWDYPSKLAYMKALKKVCTTLYSGWFRDFAIENYPEVISLYNPEKFQQVKSNLELFDLVSV